jgi:TPR repeat protein
MFTARILITTTFLISLPATTSTTQVRLNAYARAISPHATFKYGLNYLNKAATLSPIQKSLTEQAINNMIACWNSAALNYNPEAAYALGDLYEMGSLSELTSLPDFAKINANPACCKRDLDKALTMYATAAQYGRSQTFQYLQCTSTSIHAMAIKGLISLGVRFQHGVGTKQDFKKAAHCFTVALENGGTVPSYLYQKSTSTKTSDIESSKRTYTTHYDDLTIDTTVKRKAAPMRTLIQPTTEKSNPNPARTTVSFGCCGTVIHVSPDETPTTQPS